MNISLHPTGKLRDELALNAEAFGQSPEALLRNAPLRVAQMWLSHERSGGLPVILQKGDLYCLPFEFLEEYRQHSFALEFTQAGQSLLWPADDLEEDDIIDVQDSVLEKLASFVGASSSVEAYGYAVWFYNRILNLAREDYPGGIPGFFSRVDRKFDAFFPLETNFKSGGARLVAWDECHSLMALHSGQIRSAKQDDVSAEGEPAK